MRNILRVVIDTNVLVSGLFGLRDSPSSQIMHAFRAQKLILVSSLAIFEEVRGVINRERIVTKTKMNVDERKEFMDLLVERCEIIEGQQLQQTGSRDIKDNKFLACGIEAQVAYIVTGDDDSLVLKKHEGITIIKPREFLEILQK